MLANKHEFDKSRICKEFKNWARLGTIYNIFSIQKKNKFCTNFQHKFKKYSHNMRFKSLLNIYITILF